MWRSREDARGHPGRLRPPPVPRLSQAQIADRIGCSQMHVSWIIRGGPDRLRSGPPAWLSPVP